MTMARLVLILVALADAALLLHVAHSASWDAAWLVLVAWVGGVLFGLLGVLVALEEPRPARKWRAF